MNDLYSQYSYLDYFIFFKYTTLAFIILGSLILRTLYKNQSVFLRNDRNLLIIFVAFLIVFIGTRGVNIGTDTINYYRGYYLPGIHITGVKAFYNYFLDTDLLFKVIMYLTFPFKNFNLFLTIIAIVTSLGYFVFVRKFSNYGKDGSSLLLFLMIACSSSFLSFELNIIRNGIAIPFILLGLYYFLHKNFKYGYLFFLLAYLSHSTSLIPIILILAIYAFPKIKIKYFLILYIICIGISLAGYGFHSIPFLQQIKSGDLQRLSNIADTYNYRVGFRLDFVLYNSFFLFLGLKLGNMKNIVDLNLIKYYILASVIFYLNFYIPFSDRIGAYSWIVIPLILFNAIKNNFKAKHLYYSTIACLFLFILNYVIVEELLR
jgi:hypothetical protein